MRLRDYQEAALDATWDYLHQPPVGNPLVVLPTGTGKSLLIAALIEKLVKTYSSTRVLCLADVKELVDNNSETLLTIWPAAPMGVYSAGLNRRDTGTQITYAGIGSVYKRAKLYSRVDLIVIDEAHRVGDNTKKYNELIAGIKEYNPNVKVVGLTATPFRMKGGMLIDGKLFSDTAFDLSSGEAFVWLVDNGYLSRLVPKRPTVEIDVARVGIQNGEFAQGQMDAEIDAQDILPQALEEAVRSAHDRNHWLVFCSSIQKAEEAAELLNDAFGVPAKALHSRLSNKERDQVIAQFKSGEIRALVNKEILTTGFDFPAIDCIISLRPSRSPGLWVQMLGRGTRPVYAEGFDLTHAAGRLAAIAAGPKQDCLVLDFAGNTERLGPINYPKIPERRGKGGGGEAPVKECPECHTWVLAGLRLCPECGHEFPIADKTKTDASTSEVIARRKPKPEKPKAVEASYRVTQMVGTLHHKKGRPPSVRVTYVVSGRRPLVEYIGPEHPKPYVKMVARKWWHLHSPAKRDPMPSTASELLAVFSTLRTPTVIQALVGGQYDRVTGYSFTGDANLPNVRGD